MNLIPDRSKGHPSHSVKKERPLGSSNLFGILRGLEMGSGPVIISAKIRGREYSRTEPNYQIDGVPSCKHMCCREGVDKAPKAPKSSFVSAASLVDSYHLSGHECSSGRGATAKKSAAPGIPKNDQDAETEIADLAKCEILEANGKIPLKAFKRLNRLHENVTKGRTAPVVFKKHTSFDYTKGGQPQFSFLNENPSDKISSDKMSTDYAADWMGDLPSPSALLEITRTKYGPLAEHSTEDYGSWPDGLPSPSALILENNAATVSHPGSDSLEESNLPQSNDEESDLEAAMVGLSNSINMHEDLQVQAATSQTSLQAETFPHWSPPPDEPQLQHRPTPKAESSGTSRLLFSVDRTKRLAELAQKRKAGVGDQGIDASQSTLVAKRPRVSDGRDQSTGRSSSAEKQAQAPSPIIKAGQPAWVYAFDAAFIAEWQNIVDFI